MGLPCGVSAAACAHSSRRRESSSSSTTRFTQGAAKALLPYYTDKPLAGGSGNVTVNAVINSLPPQLVAALWRAMALASGRQPVGLLGTSQ